MTHRKNSPMEPMQMTRRYRAIDSTMGEAERSDQLLNRDNSVLPLGEIRERPRCNRKVRRPFVPHSG